jgi:uncharacterized protein (TIGR03437 family)
MSRRDPLHNDLTRIAAGLCVATWVTAASGQSTQPVRWQAQYSQIYSDNIETVGPALGPAFILGSTGSLTSNPSEVIAGRASIKGASSGSGDFTPFLRNDPTAAPLLPSHTYELSFRYKILTAPSDFYKVWFFSPSGVAPGPAPQQVALRGQAGASGIATLTNTLGPYSDYQLRWDISGTGAIAIDAIQLLDVTAGKVIATEDAELQLPGPGRGLLMKNGAGLVRDPAQALAGTGSVLLSTFASLETNPAIVALGPNTTYIVECQYRIINSGADNPVMGIAFGDSATRDPVLSVNPQGSLLKNAPKSGTFSAGAQTAGSNSYFLAMVVSAGATVVIDDIVIYRQDPIQSASPPEAWKTAETLPFPRLGKYGILSPSELAQLPPVQGVPPLPAADIEKRLSLFDIYAGLHPKTQTMEADAIRRLRLLNPALMILPYRLSEEQGLDVASPAHSTVDIDYNFFQGVADGWYARTSSGGYVTDPVFPIREMNLSDNAPVINGETFGSYLTSFLTATVFPPGVWDGVFFDNLFGRVNPHIPDYNDPALFDVDYNRNGLRDETPASASEITRKFATGLMTQLRNQVGDLQIFMGNAGNLPDRSLAPYVNGYVFECFNETWYAAEAPVEGGWRHFLDSYRFMQATPHRPTINLLEGCGRSSYDSPDPGQHPEPGATARDIQRHRIALGSALLGDGYYGYDLLDFLSPPYWFDEYAVDGSGTAVESRAGKGYLGAALTDAEELSTASTPVLQETFESGSIPTWLFVPPGAAMITRQPEEVISGTASLVLDNPDHTKRAFTSARTNPAEVPLPPGTYLFGVDYKILETLDSRFFSGVGDNVTALGGYQADGVVKGDSGTIHFPVTISSPGDWYVFFALADGGGKVAIDNLRISRGGPGPWRRDFENGFVLVNPLLYPHTFSVTELAGRLNRTGIRRIKGTQAPEVNNGQAVTGDLTLGAFDAIILLADPIRLGAPVVTGVANAAGGQPGVASGSFVSIYGSNFTPLPYDDWSKSIVNGQLPTQLDGIGVTIGGKPAYIYAITPAQINVQAPDVGNGSVQVIVTSAAGASVPVSVNSQMHSPAFFPWPGSQPVATHADYTWAAKTGTFPGTTTVAAKPGEVITLWGTGFGPTNPAVPAGHVPTVAATPTQSPVTVTLGGTAVPVLGAVLSSYAAVYQIAIQIPASMPDGSYALVASVNGAQSPPNVLLAVQR